MKQLLKKQNKNYAVECNVKNRYENSDKCSIGESDYDETQKIDTQKAALSAMIYLLLSSHIAPST